MEIQKKYFFLFLSISYKNPVVFEKIKKNDKKSGNKMASMKNKNVEVVKPWSYDFSIQSGKLKLPKA